MKEKTFYSYFSEEEKEFVVVMISGVSGGKAAGDTCWTMTADFLAYECDGEIFENRGFLCWLASNDEEERKHESDKFKSNRIYRIKARELKEKQTERYRNRLLVTQILNCDVQSPQLETILEKYNEPLTIEDDILGTLTLDKQYFELSTEIQFGNNEDVCISMEVDDEDKDSWEEPINVARQLVQNAEKLDMDMRKFAAKELTGNANDWQDNLDEDLPEITQEQFAKRIVLESIHVYEDGDYTAYYDDDDMFYGHVVVVDANIDTGFESSYLEG